MPLTELDPPRVLPRTHASTRSVGPNGRVGKNHANFGFPRSLPKPRGMRIMRLLSLPPASSSNTRFAGFSERRLASTQPAEPAPTMM